MDGKNMVKKNKNGAEVASPKASKKNQKTKNTESAERQPKKQQEDNAHEQQSSIGRYMNRLK